MDPYAQINNRRTSQTEPIMGESQIKNNAGGYVYALSSFAHLARFLILGSEGGSYYVSEKKLTKENAINALAAIEADGRRAVDLIVQISQEGRAPKNDPAIFALALAASAKDPDTRALALGALPKVCRIPTHLFHFLTYVQNFRGYGRGLKRAVANWYQDKEVNSLAYQMVKYQSRDGWSNADALRLSHPKTSDPIRNTLYKWAVDGYDGLMDRLHKEEPNVDGGQPRFLPAIVQAFEDAKTSSNLVSMIRENNLAREMLPTEALKDPKVWEALLERMPVGALIRNLGNLSKCGLLTPLSDASKKVQNVLRDREALKKARIHPIQILIAQKTYAQGRGILGKGEWNVVGAVVDALDDAFYAAFDYTEPTGKAHLVAVDVSGSMNAQIAGIPNFSAAEAAAVMAMATVKIEQNYEIILFNSHVVGRPVITPRMRLDEVRRAVSGNGSTNCAAPMEWALKNRVRTDCFVILTDNETWAGRYGHPSQVMRDYRNAVNSKAKIINLGMTSTVCTINDPNDLDALDVAGFDASIPQIISEFVKL